MMILRKKDKSRQIVLAYSFVEKGKYVYLEDETGKNIITLEEFDLDYQYLGDILVQDGQIDEMEW